MAAIFPTRPGQVVAVEDPTLVANTEPAISLDPAFSFDAQKAIIQRVTIAQAANVQFLHTLGQQIFVYTFGDRIGQMTLSGLAFASRCNETDLTSASEPGIEAVLNYYNENKVSKREETMQVTLGQNLTLEGFLTKIQADLVDPAASLFRFSMNLAIVPEAP